MQNPPLQGIKVLEFAGLAPAPFCGLLCADYGADVVRIDRKTDQGKPTNDLLCRNKRSICVDLKNPADLDKVIKLVRRADVVIEPFRPGVMEKLGLGPEVLLKENERLVYARLTGFRRDGKYKERVLATNKGKLDALKIKRAMISPIPPANILGDFAVWNGPRGTNNLDGGCPFYDTYETSDGRFMAVGALEPQFFRELMKGLRLPCDDQLLKTRQDKKTWPAMRESFEAKFKAKSREEWERVFDGTDACCTPVLTQEELEEGGFEQRAMVHLSQTPAVESDRQGITLLLAGQHQDEVFAEWLGDKVSSRL
ncbi:hypothetical protein ABW19_dt0206791 [Dactylella cylindrospora]|nr:hypothetical protein ABW19_dt0206791 [Dactylella cylindrospora]